jgi:SAM-dependent methyltransferase
LDNAEFWNERYRLFPQLGGGPGSRGYAASYKNALVKEVMIQHDVRSIVDVGCGDLCWLDQDILEGRRYVGLDISTVAIEQARAAYPSLQFAAFDVTAQRVGVKSDLVVSFDVLIHQIDIRTFQAALGNMLAAIGKIGLVSYITPPMKDGGFPPPATLDPTAAGAAEIESESRFQEMMTRRLASDFPKAATAFHQPLPAAVAALRPDLEVSTAGRYRYQTVYAIRVPIADNMQPKHIEANLHARICG